MNIIELLDRLLFIMNSSPVQLLLLTLLPLQLLSLASRLLHKPLAQRFNAARSALLLVSIPILLSAIFAFPNAEPSKDVAFSSELEKLKLKIDHLGNFLKLSVSLFHFLIWLGVHSCFSLSRRSMIFLRQNGEVMSGMHRRQRTCALSCVS